MEDIKYNIEKNQYNNYYSILIKNSIYWIIFIINVFLVLVFKGIKINSQINNIYNNRLDKNR